MDLDFEYSGLPSPTPGSRRALAPTKDPPTKGKSEELQPPKAPDDMQPSTTEKKEVKDQKDRFLSASVASTLREIMWLSLLSGGLKMTIDTLTETSDSDE